MPSLFQEAAAIASAAVDDVFGEEFLYQPMTADDVNARPSIDPNRAPLTIVAAFLDSYARAESGPARTQGVAAERPGHASSRPQVTFDRRALPYDVCKGDRLTRVDTGETFQVAEPRKSDGPRIALDLNRI